MHKKKTIVVIEDEPLVQQSLEKNLSDHGFEVFAFSTAEEALASALLGLANLVIMDIGLPGADGLQTTLVVKEQFPSIPVIMLTAFSEVTQRIQGFATGADDYIIKPFFMEELLARIQAVLKRYEMLPSVKQVYTFHDLVIDNRRKQVTRRGQPIKLSQTEFALLLLLAEEEGHPVTKDTILQRVWKNRVSDNTIEVYINLLRNKVDKSFDQRLIHTKPGFGYFLSVNAQ